MEDAVRSSEHDKVPLAPFALIRILLGTIWIYEWLRDAPWSASSALIGIPLLIGLLTPIAALFGLILTFHVYSVAANPEAWGVWPWLYWMIILMHLVVFFTAAGRVWGVDSIFLKRRPLWPIW